MESRANRVGDILTVAFTESFQATKSQNAATSKSSENSVTLPTVVDNIVPAPTYSRVVVKAPLQVLGLLRS